MPWARPAHVHGCCAGCRCRTTTRRRALRKAAPSEVYVVARFHALVEHAGDLDDIRRDQAIVKDKCWPLHPGHRALAACAADMQTAKTGKKIVALARQRALRISLHQSNRGAKQCCIAMTRFDAPSFGTDSQNCGEVRFCGARDANRCQRFNVPGLSRRSSIPRDSDQGRRPGPPRIHHAQEHPHRPESELAVP